MDGWERERKLTEKDLVIKIEKLKKEHKHAVNKIRCLIPRMKELMKERENVSQENSIALCGSE